MGYDVVRFVNICELLEDELICVICIGIYEDPVITSCDHIFCNECIQRWFRERRSCPVCETKVTHLDDRLKSPPLIIKNILGKLKLHCDYQDDGCKDIIRLDSLISHTNQCKHRPISIQTKASITQMFNKVLNFFSDRRGFSRNVQQARPEIQRNPIRLFRFINRIYERRGLDIRGRMGFNIRGIGRNDDNINDERIAHVHINQAIETYLKSFFILILGTYVLAALIDWLCISVTNLSQFCLEHPCIMCGFMCGFLFVWYRQNAH